MRRRNVEEILEALWLAGESSWEPEVQEVLDRAHGDVDAVDLGDAISAGLIRQEGGQLRLTEPGEAAAGLIVRRHRLAERLLSDVLQISGTYMESSACEFEHFLSPEVTDSICTLLGHPTVCPHNNPIPPGPCCGKLVRETGAVVRRLSEVPVGERVKIVFVATNQEKRLERLGSMGVHPGGVLRLVQSRPSFIVEVDQTSLAFEREVAESVYVRRWVPESDLARSVKDG